MTDSERKPREKFPHSMGMILNALELASQGKPPYEDKTLFRTTLLQKMGLDSPKKDGKLLMDRFTNRFHPFRDLREDVSFRNLLKEVLGPEANDYQQQLRTDLVAIAERQFSREQKVCSGVIVFVLNAPDRFLTEFSGLKERVFEMYIDREVIRKKGLLEEGRMLSYLVLQAFDLTPPTHEDFTLPPGIIFTELDEEIVEIDHTALSSIVDESERSAVLESMPKNLDMFWVQQSGEEVPHPLIPRGKKEAMKPIVRDPSS